MLLQADLSCQERVDLRKRKDDLDLPLPADLFSNVDKEMDCNEITDEQLLREAHEDDKPGIDSLRMPLDIQRSFNRVEKI